MVSHIDWNDLDKFKFLTIGPTLFFGVRFALYPPTLVKTRLQLQDSQATVSSNSGGKKYRLYRGTFDAFRVIAKEEGVAALWKGFVPKSLGIIAGSAYISTYEVVRSKCLNKMGWTQTYSDMTAGALASLVSQTIVVPTDVVSQSMSIIKSNDSKKNSLVEHVKGIYQERGSTVRGFYRGFGISVCTYMPTSAIWWTTYGLYKPFIFRLLSPSTNDDSGAMKNIFHVHDEFYRNIICQSISGSLAGATAGALSNPIDIIKVRKQLLPKDISLSQIVNDLLREAGPKAFLKGITARMLSMFGSGMVTVSVYELIKRLSRKDSSRQDSM